MKIWCNVEFSPEPARLLAEGLAGHELVIGRNANRLSIVAAAGDPDLADAEVALGQPDPRDCLSNPRLRWVEVASAGYTRYDTPAIREGFTSRRMAMTIMSEVFSEPCAQHILAMMLALGRQLLPSHDNQLGERGWHFLERRAQSVLLTGQTVVMLGFGSIGHRLAQLLAPFDMELYAVRRRAHSETGVRIVPESELTRVLGIADHVVNILPESEATLNYVNARRIACFKPGVCYYSVGRGPTTDHAALAEGLLSGRIGSAYLDVMVPEPLPPDHPLWTTPHCHITPHSAGGRSDEGQALVRHFLGNLAAFTSGGSMRDRII